MTREPERALAIARAVTTARLMDATPTDIETRRVLDAIIARDLPKNPTSLDIARWTEERRAARVARETT